MNAKEILMRAVQRDQEGRILEAQLCYEAGIQILMELVNDETDVKKKKTFRERIKEYIDRAEQIKERVVRQTSQGELVSHIAIRENDTGNSYNSLFGEYITTELKEVHLEEPYLAAPRQFYNLIAFFELLVKRSHSLKFIHLITKTDSKNPSNQSNILGHIKTDLQNRDITLSIKYDDSLHDRKIILSNGYIIKSGYGLDIFKPINPQFSLGITDYDLRKCKQTDVDIWRTKYIS